MAEEFRQPLLEGDGPVGREEPHAGTVDEDALLADAAVNVARQFCEVFLGVEDEGTGRAVLLLPHGDFECVLVLVHHSCGDVLLAELEVDCSEGCNSRIIGL